MRRVMNAKVLAVGIVVVAVSGTTIATAAALGSADVLRGCVARGGAVRVVAPGVGCNAGERSITWNKQGLAGSAGAQGMKGATGDKGPTGDAGPAGPAGAGGAGGAPTGAVGGDFAGTYPDPYLDSTSAICAFRQRSGGPLAFWCAGSRPDPTTTHPTAGVYCFKSNNPRNGGAVTIEASSPGYPSAYMSTTQTYVDFLCGAGTSNVVVVTYTQAGDLHDEEFYGILR